MKAVIPAAGFGTRFLPIAKAVPKEMLPLGDKPVIHYVVEEAMEAGFDEILIILSRGKEAIVNYFRPHPELEQRLESSGKLEALKTIKDLASMARFSFVYQDHMRGLGDAIRYAESFVGQDAVAVLLGDTVIAGESPLPALVKAGASAVAIEPCPPERASKYGIAGGVAAEDGNFQLSHLVEKPSPDAIPQLLGLDGLALPPHAFAARYFFSAQIFQHLAKAKPGFGGEIQLTDAMQQLAAGGTLTGVPLVGKRLDIGSPDGLIDAAIYLRSVGGRVVAG
ncbi:MAG: UTP--glucose-1-phosphate uridylyltransferase [Verrucomicrobiales bacterium]